MKRYGYAIRSGGDPEISGALAEGIDRGTRLAIIQRSDEAVRRVAMRRHTPEEWAAMTAQARYDYGQDQPAPRWARCLLAGYALICYGLSLLHHQQDRILNRRTV